MRETGVAREDCAARARINLRIGATPVEDGVAVHQCGAPLGKGHGDGEARYPRAPSPYSAGGGLTAGPVQPEERRLRVPAGAKDARALSGWA
jgi:hypothetical protein